MLSMTEIAGAISSLKAAKDVAEAMIGLRDAAAFQEKRIELQSKILDAQSSMLAAQDERATLIERIRHLEQEVARLEAWDAEKQKYEFCEPYPGAFAFILKPDAQGTEPAHWLCAHCYDRGKKSRLQSHGRGDPPYIEIYKCSDCKNQI